MNVLKCRQSALKKKNNVNNMFFNAFFSVSEAGINIFICKSLKLDCINSDGNKIFVLYNFFLDIPFILVYCLIQSRTVVLVIQ